MQNVSIHSFLVSLGIVAAGGVSAYVVYYLFRWVGKKADRSRYRIDGLVLRVIGRPLSVLIALLSLTYSLYRIPAIRQQFSRWDGAQRAVLVIIGTWIVASLVKNVVREYGLPMAHRTDTDVDERIVRVLDLTAVYIIWVAGILVALRELGIQVTAFLASLGIAGLAVALAAKTILSNVLAGLTLTADRNFRVGDRIEVGGYVGDVLEINLHKSVIRTRDNEIVLIPNDVLGKEVIVNHVLPEEKTRIEMSIGVAYNADLEKATSILHSILQDIDRILSEPAPEVNVTSLGDSAVVLQILVWIDGPRGKRTIRDVVYRQALARYEEAGIEIPFPQRTIHFPRADHDRLGERDARAADEFE